MIIIDLLLHCDKYITLFISEYGFLTYFILFGIVFCETGLVFLPFLPGDSLIFAAGSFAALGSLNYFFLSFLLISAAILGDGLNYIIGKKFGNKIINAKKVKLIKKENIDKATEFIQKNGAKSIFLARFVPIIRTIVPFVVGMGQMDKKQFIKYNTLGGIVWVELFINIGYFFGNIKVVQDNFSLIIIAIIAISFIPVGFSVIKPFLEKHKKSKNI